MHKIIFWGKKVKQQCRNISFEILPLDKHTRPHFKMLWLLKAKLKLRAAAVMNEWTDDEWMKDQLLLLVVVLAVELAISGVAARGEKLLTHRALQALLVPRAVVHAQEKRSEIGVWHPSHTLWWTQSEPEIRQHTPIHIRYFHWTIQHTCTHSVKKAYTAKEHFHKQPIINNLGENT